MMGVTLKDRKRVEDIRTIAKVEDIKKIRLSKWRWTGHDKRKLHEIGKNYNGMVTM